jgi:hypothetical protein
LSSRAIKACAAFAERPWIHPAHGRSTTSFRSRSRDRTPTPTSNSHTVNAIGPRVRVCRSQAAA